MARHSTQETVFIKTQSAGLTCRCLPHCGRLRETNSGRQCGRLWETAGDKQWETVWETAGDTLWETHDGRLRETRFICNSIKSPRGICHL